MVVWRKIIFLLVVALLAGCAGKGAQLRRAEEFSAPAEKKSLYVVPFTTVMVPVEVEEGIFDRFVDALNAGGQPLEYDFFILKEGLEAVDPQWLRQQDYLTGEIYAYVEDSGCCSTTIRVRSRLQFHQPDRENPTLTLEYPREIFFEHDYSSVEEERRKLSEDIAATLANRLLQALSDR